MRTPTIIEGLKNSQRFKVVINSVDIGNCQVKDLMNGRFRNSKQKDAVEAALTVIGDSFAKPGPQNYGPISGYMMRKNRVNVYVCLI